MAKHWDILDAEGEFQVRNELRENCKVIRKKLYICSKEVI